MSLQAAAIHPLIHQLPVTAASTLFLFFLPWKIQGFGPGFWCSRIKCGLCKMAWWRTSKPTPIVWRLERLSSSSTQHRLIFSVRDYLTITDLRGRQLNFFVYVELVILIFIHWQKPREWRPCSALSKACAYLINRKCETFQIILILQSEYACAFAWLDTGLVGYYVNALTENHVLLSGTHNQSDTRSNLEYHEQDHSHHSH